MKNLWIVQKSSSFNWKTFTDKKLSVKTWIEEKEPRFLKRSEIDWGDTSNLSFFSHFWTITTEMSRSIVLLINHLQRGSYCWNLWSKNSSSQFWFRARSFEDIWFWKPRWNFWNFLTLSFNPVKNWDSIWKFMQGFNIASKKWKKIIF